MTPRSTPRANSIMRNTSVGAHRLSRAVAAGLVLFILGGLDAIGQTVRQRSAAGNTDELDLAESFRAVPAAAQLPAAPAPLPAPGRGGDELPVAPAPPIIETTPQALQLLVADAYCAVAPTQSGAPFVCGVDCGPAGAPCYSTWDDERPIPWSVFGQGEYIGPARTAHVPQYHLRVDDELNLVYMLSREKTSQPYQLGVGDQIQVESPVEESLVRTVEIQPDGTVTLPYIGEVPAAGKTLRELRDDLNDRYEPIFRVPEITVTPIASSSVYQTIIDSVDRRGGAGGLSQTAKVTPEGTIQLTGLGSIFVQGLTLEELQREVEERYRDKYGPGLSVTPLLTQRAPRYLFVVGEVRNPGRYTLEGPTTIMQAIALAGGWNVGGNTNHVVVFRRDENWCLKAIRVDVRDALYGKDPCPVDDVWLRDNDLVVVPKRPILVADDVIELYFTRGIYRVFPISFVKSFGESTVLPVGP